MKQTALASAAWEKKGKVTRRERFLGEMDAAQSRDCLLRFVARTHKPHARSA